MPRDTRLTLWPEQIGFLPLTSSWAEIKNTTVLDFSHCATNVRSCGLAATALNLSWIFKANMNLTQASNKKQNEQLKLIYPEDSLHNEKQSKLKNNIRYIEKIIPNKKEHIISSCAMLGFFLCIEKYINEELRSLYCADKEKNEIIHSGIEYKKTSFPIFYFDISKYKHNPREILDVFLNYSIPIFDKIFSHDIEKGNQINHILVEIVKNIADHADADGFVGIDCDEYDDRKMVSILIGDCGPGIYQHMRDHYIKKRFERGKYTGLAEVYRFALLDEVSTSSNRDNYGCGMSTIINNCLDLDVQISVFDEASRLVLSSLSRIKKQGPSHNELWRSSHRFDGKKPFFYFLQCEEKTR